MNKTTRSLWLRVLSIVLVVLLLPVANLTALADDAAPVAETTNVAKVGNVEYATIDEAIANWTNGTTLTLLADVTLSDVITFKSTEHHILNLGTYTMTAADGKNAFVIKACGTGDSERTAITIKADAENPGGINAGKNCVVYYKYADGGISGNDRPIIKIEGGVFTGSTSGWGTAGIYTIGKEARKCATLNISGGTFNCSINGSSKSKLLISGGTFNYSVGSQGDSTALRLISGGKFKTLGFMTADSNNTKFWFGTSMANSNVGLYVDKEGYLVVGGPVINELSAKYSAVASNATEWSSYLAYSSAATYGLFYEDADMAIKKHGEANVTIYEKPAITIPENVTGDATVVEEIKNNTALKGYAPEIPENVEELVIELKSVEEKIVYDVTPIAEGIKVEPTAAITFRLPIPASVTDTYAKVYHDGETKAMGYYKIQGEGDAKYIEISTDDFSEFAVETVTPTKGYYLTIYNADGSVGMNIDGTMSIDDFCLRSAIEDARAFANNGFLFGISGPATFVVEMFEDSIEDQSFTIGADVTVNGNGHKIVLGSGVTLTNNGTFNDVIVEEPVYAACIGNVGYATLAEAFAALTEGDTLVIFAGEYSEGAIKLPATLKNVTIKGENGAILKDMTISAADGNSVVYEGLTFDGIVFDNSNIVLTGWRTGEVPYKDITVTNCTFKNIVRTSNEAAIHINCNATEAVYNFTFTNNVIDGVSGASNSGIYLQATGEIVVENNVINNVAFRPYVIQLTVDDGIADEFTVTGNTFSGSAAGRAQGLGNNAAGTDEVDIVVSNNIFKGITSSQQICYWNFNADTTTAELSGNYYDIDIIANPNKVYFNSAAQDVMDLVDMGIFPIYTELNADGTINTESAFNPADDPAFGKVAQIGDQYFDTLAEAFAAVTSDDQTVIILADVTENLAGAYLRGNIVGNATITLTNADWVYCPYTFVIGEGITLNVPALFYYAGGSVIRGTVVAGAYYQRYAVTKLTIEAPGSMTVTSETCIIRYMDNDPNAGIYIVGDNDDSTVELKLAVAYFYQGMINAKDATIVCGTYWQTNETDGQGSANLVLDNSKLTVSVYDHPAKATGNSTVTLKNGSTMDCRNGGFTYGDNAVISIDSTSSIIGKNGEEVQIPVAQIGNVKFESIQAAVNAAQAGDVIEIIADVSDETVVVDKNLTITGMAALNNVSISANGATEFTVSGLSFTGNSWINAGTANKLTVSGVTADVTPSNASATNSRSAFISLGRSEQHQLALTVENCSIVSRGGSDPILGWAAITEANLIGNTFGSASAYQNNSDSVKFMSIAQGAIINIVNNTVYSNYNGIVLGQNTTRGNSYTAIFSGNTFLGSADHIWIEVSGSNTYNGNIIVTSDNTINGSAIGVSGIVLRSNLNTFTGYAGIDVVLNNEGKVVGGVMKFAAEGTIADGYELDDNGNVVEAKNYVASINGVNYNTFEEALVAAKSMSGDVVVGILDKVTLNVALSGSFDSITFVGKTETAEIYLDVQGYITATGKKVAFEDLILSKAEGGYVTNAGFMNLAFGIFDVVEVTYTDCTFANGAFASSGKVNFIGCTFYRSYDRYGMWAYGNADILVDGCTFADIRGIKMYSEGMERTGNLTVKGTDFSAAGQKPAIVLTSGASVTLDDTNTYSSKGVFELDLDGVPNGTIVNVPATITCVNDNGACGVIVDGKIYTTVAQAAEVATSGSTVTLLHNSNETVELAVGVVLDKNGYTADGVTVRVPYVAEVNGVQYETLEAAFKAATSGCTIEILADVVVDYYWDARNTGAKFTVPVTIDGNGHTITFTNTVYDGGNYFAAFRFEADATVIDLTVDMTNAISGFAGRFRAISAKANLTVDGCTFLGNGSANNTRAIIFGEGAGANTANLVISVTNSSFEGWRQGVSDNENAQDAKSVTITGNTFEDAGVNVSATDTVVFTANTVSGRYVKIKSYSAKNNLVVTATGNTLTANEDDTTNCNYIFAKDVDAQEDFIVEIYFKATAMIGDKGFATVADAVEYAKAEGITDLVITLVGETTRDSAAALEDVFYLYNTTAFDSVTIKQEDKTVPYYIDGIYTGRRNNGGEFIFDGVNIVVVGQYIFEGNVKLINNSVIKSVAAANCFLYYSTTTVEAGSKLYGVIDELRGGTLIVDGGRDDGEFNTVPDVHDAILGISWSGDSVTLKNGAYVKVNAANEVGRVTVATGTSLNVYNAKFEACQHIENNGTINLNTESVITTAKLYGAGAINIDATNLEGRVTVIESKDLASFTGTITITGNEFAKYEITENGLEIVYVEPVVQIGDVKYGTLDEAIEAAVAGDEIVLLKDITITADTTLPAGITLNGNGKSITGAVVWAAGDLAFKGHTKLTGFNAGYNKPVITIGEGACLELVGTGRMVLGHGATFNITGTIADAKTADVAELTPSLIAAGASFTGAGLNFNVTNAYVKFTAYCSSKNSAASGTFNFNVTNSIWNQTNTLVFSEPTSGKDPTINFNLKDSVLTSTSHLVFAVTKGEIVIDNSNVNVGSYKQLENRSNMTIKNGSVVYAAFATSSNAKNPGTLTVDNATLISSGEFSGSDLEIGTLNVKNNANVIVGNISKANVTVDVTSVLTVTKILAETSVKVDATAFDGAEVLVIKSANLANYTAIELVGCDTAALVLDANGVTVVSAVAKIGDQIFTSLKAAVEAVEDGDTIVLLTDEIITEATRTHNSGSWYDGIYYVGDKSFTIDLNGFTITHDGSVNDYLLNFKNVGTKANTITIKNGTVDAGTSAFCAICTSSVQENQLTINLENLNVINNISNGSTIKVRGGVILNVNDGTTITGKNSYLGIECIASTVNIYDGAEIYMNGATSYNGCLVGVGAGGTVNVYGGYGKGVKGGFIAMTSGGTINISGGEWIANTDGTVGNNSNYYVLTAQSNKYEGGFVGASIINVTGGTLRGGMDAWVLNNIEGEQAEINISGGNFNVNPARFVVDGYEEVENADGTYDVKVERWNIEYTNVYLTENFTMAFAFAKDSEKSWNGYYAVITKGDDEANTLVVPYAEWDVVSINAANDHFAIYYKGIVAKEMNEVVTITIFDADGNQVSNTESESIKSYAMGMFDYTTEAKLKTLVVDILNYGAEAQLYFNYSIDTLANSELTDEHQANASAAREYVEIGDTSCADGYAFNFFTNVVLDNNIQIMFAFQNLNSVEFSEDAKIVISYNDHDGNLVKNELAISDAQIEDSFIIVTVDSFSALDSSALVTCELVEGETVIASVSDSVEGYVARITDESMIKVGTAMMKYCDSAYAYFYGTK